MNKYMHKMIKYTSDNFQNESNAKLFTNRIVGIEGDIIYINRGISDVFQENKFSFDLGKLFEILVACDLENDFYFRIIDNVIIGGLGSYNMGIRNIEPYILKLAMMIASDMAHDKRTFIKLTQIVLELDEIDDNKKFFISFIDGDGIIKNIECREFIIELLNTYEDEEGDITL